MSIKTIAICFLLVLGNSLRAEEVFYKSCDEDKTTVSFVKTNDQCAQGICEMKSYCKTNKGELYVEHLCPSSAKGTCPSMIDCLDNSTISHRSDEKLVPTNNNSNPESSTGVSK